MVAFSQFLASHVETGDLCRMLKRCHSGIVRSDAQGCENPFRRVDRGELEIARDSPGLQSPGDVVRKLRRIQARGRLHSRQRVRRLL